MAKIVAVIYNSDGVNWEIKKVTWVSGQIDITRQKMREVKNGGSGENGSLVKIYPKHYTVIRVCRQHHQVPRHRFNLVSDSLDYNYRIGTRFIKLKFI